MVAANVASVDQSDTAVTLLAANPSRTGVMIFNEASAALLVKFGTGASASSYSVRLAQYQYFESMEDILYTDVITGIWESAGASAAKVTEFTGYSRAQR